MVTKKDTDTGTGESVPVAFEITLGSVFFTLFTWKLLYEYLSNANKKSILFIFAVNHEIGQGKFFRSKVLVKKLKLPCVNSREIQWVP